MGPYENICALGTEVWYVSDILMEVWPCTVTAIRAEWALGNDDPAVPAITFTLARHNPSQLTIQTDLHDFGKGVHLTERDAYNALEVLRRHGG